ncbi:MAG: phosphatidylserine decarboxylase [Rhodocyclaceae bacterium]|nr:phosphatidylserine decarboxylase [Rhodocyclaceae bacterium]
MTPTPWPHPLIAREGWPFVGGSLLLAVATWLIYGFAASVAFWVIAVFVLQFFRDPPRQVPAGDGLVLSPADGRIVKVVQAHDPHADRPALLISVFMNVFNVHSNRVSVGGTVRAVEYFPGKFVNADLDKASLENERNAVLLDTPRGTVTLVQVAGLIARRILCYVQPGQAVVAGERYGFIRFGSRVDVYLPADAVPRVVIGQKVSATETVLAEFAAP